MKKSVQILSTLLVSFISAELLLQGRSETYIEEICEKETTNEILEEII